METITLSDGREFQVGSLAIASSGHLFIRVNMNLFEAAREFASGTDRIIYTQEDGESIVINGFTELAYIVNEADCVRVALVRPAIEGLNNG